MAEDDCGFVATSAFNVHEVAVRGGNQSGEFVFVLLSFKGGVQEISIHLW